MVSDGGLPAVTAFVLGLIVALHPCPLATNIAAMGYIGSSIGGRRRLFMRGLAYAVGRVAGYSLPGMVLAILVRHGIDVLAVGDTLGRWGERLLAPVLIVAGVYFIVAHLLHNEEHCHTVGNGRRWARTYTGSFLLGVLLALAFCPESAIVYFGMIIPMAAENSDGAGYLLPAVFAVATSLPVIILAWCFAYSMTKLAAVRRRMHDVQRWMSIIVGALFVAAGLLLLFV